MAQAPNILQKQAESDTSPSGGKTTVDRPNRSAKSPNTTDMHTETHRQRVPRREEHLRPHEAGRLPTQSHLEQKHRPNRNREDTTISPGQSWGCRSLSDTSSEYISKRTAINPAGSASAQASGKTLPLARAGMRDSSLCLRSQCVPCARSACAPNCRSLLPRPTIEKHPCAHTCVLRDCWLNCETPMQARTRS